LIKDERWLLRPDLLRKLGSRYALGIVTGRPRREAEYTLERFDVADLFQVVVAMEDTPQGRGKPDPCGVELAMDKLGVRRAMYLGDTVDDVQAAIAASAIPVGVVSKGARAEEQCDLLKAHGAVVVLEDVEAIVEVVK
jgi:HAD superfamily hydrolase (TIGR01549 family)